MSLLFKTQYVKRFFYEPNKTETYKFPSGNLFSAIEFLNKLKINVKTDTASGVPDFQIMNAIDRVELVRDSSKLVWSISGQALSLLYGRKHGTGALPANNSVFSGTVADGKTAQTYLHVPFAPLGAFKDTDYMCDTRSHDYELKIKWKDITEVGVLFGVISGTVEAVTGDSFLQIQLEQAIPRANPASGQNDRLSRNAPLIVGLREDKKEITASNTKYQIDMAQFQNYRNVFLYTTHKPSANREIGVGNILNNLVKLYDTQNEFYHDVQSEILHERTAQMWGQGTDVNDGFYDLDLTLNGSAFDILRSNNVTDLFIDLDVTKLANETNIRPIYMTQQAQGR